MWVRIALVALAIGAFVWIVTRFSTAGHVFSIRVKQGRAQLKGRVPGQSASQVCRFVESLGLPEGTRINAVRDGERFTLEFSEGVPADERQRLRNFLYLGL